MWVRTEFFHFLVRLNRFGVVALLAVGVTQLLVQRSRERSYIFVGRLALDSGDGIGEDLHGVVVACLVFVKQCFVIKNLETAGRKLLRL